MSLCNVRVVRDLEMHLFGFLKRFMPQETHFPIDDCK